MMQDPRGTQSEAVPPYSSYTYDSPNFLVRYPHRKRNELVSEAISSINSESWLDYGAGDGALVTVLQTKGALPTDILLYEPDDSMRQQLISNVGILGNRVSSTGVWEELKNRKYDLITALEVLEHLPLPERIKFYSLLANVLEINGKCLIEVPVEYGPVLLLKEFGRKYLKRRKSEYSFGEVVDALFGRIRDSNLRYDCADMRSFISPHRGFNLDSLLQELECIGKCREIARSPFSFLPRMFNQVVLFEFELIDRDGIEIERKIFQLYKT